VKWKNRPKELLVSKNKFGGEIEKYGLGDLFKRGAQAAKKVAKAVAKPAKKLATEGADELVPGYAKKTQGNIPGFDAMTNEQKVAALEDYYVKLGRQRAAEEQARKLGIYKYLLSP